jgi:alpha-amylase/alpha-mannosidase (GH57 family)
LGGPPANKFICLHGHFYQPPRENPWLEMVELQDGASPYHDWNQRITAECYAPNTAARILDSDGMVQGLLNNYEHISFNIGPTLLSWLAGHAPEVMDALLEANGRSQARHGGHSNALAQPYGHSILPLDTPRDRITQVRWGIHSFSRFFGHRPEGMWLPETAVDMATLDVLAQEGILFTILAPHQALRVRPLGQGSWRDVREDLDVTRPYLCRLPAGRRINIFFYHGPISRAVAFEGLLGDGESLYKRILSAFSPGETQPQLVQVATDGETYGHHHRFGEMALAYALHRALGDPAVRLTNQGEFLELHPPTWEVQIREGTSWSCAHGLERWRSDCGCRVGGPPHWTQRWRAPLREALDWLKQGLDRIFQEKGSRVLADPWEARDHYIRVLLEPPGEGLETFWSSHRAPGAERAELQEAMKLLEMQRHGLLMFTSCGWFFDEISGLETTQILRYAARAIQLARDLGEDLEKGFLGILEKAPSNVPSLSNGRGVWEAQVRPWVVEPARVVAQHGVRSVFRDRHSCGEIPAYKVIGLQNRLETLGTARVALGSVRVASRRTLESTDYLYAVIHFGGLDLACFQRPLESEEDWPRLVEEVRIRVRDFSVGELYSWMREEFPHPVFHLKDLFTDDRRRLIQTILQDRFEDYVHTLENLAEHDLGMLEHLAAMGFPIPEALVMAATVYVSRRIQRILEELPQDGARLEEAAGLLERSMAWGYKPDRAQWARLLSSQMESSLEAVQRRPTEASSEFHACMMAMRAAQRLGITLNLWRAQNLFIKACEENWWEFGDVLRAAEELAGEMKLREKLLPWHRTD